MYRILFLLCFCLSVFSCKKAWLETKPNQGLVIPRTLEDLQGLLDNTMDVFNKGIPALGEISSDDYYLLLPTWEALSNPIEKNAYTWEKDIYEGGAVTDWMLPYQQVFYCNYVLENIIALPKDSLNTEAWDNVMGTALFCRAYAFYNLVTTFAPPYESASAGEDAGIPLKTTTDINSLTPRASVAESYRQIISDLQAALKYLPEQPQYKTRPGKAAAYTMLARATLDQGRYHEAYAYADSALQIPHELMDYNMIDLAAPFPFPLFNQEVIYHAVYNYPRILRNTVCFVDSMLFNSYDTGDLRRYAFFDTISGPARFKGGYDGYYAFTGIAVDECYLLKAEAAVRTNNISAALETLNDLLEKRFRTGSFVPVTGMDTDSLLQRVITERRKELLFRGLRWNDLRRLNKEPMFATTLTRKLGDKLYTLAPGDPRYVMPIPIQEIQTSGIEQNPR